LNTTLTEQHEEQTLPATEVAAPPIICFGMDKDFQVTAGKRPIVRVYARTSGEEKTRHITLSFEHLERIHVIDDETDDATESTRLTETLEESQECPGSLEAFYCVLDKKRREGLIIDMMLFSPFGSYIPLKKPTVRNDENGTMTSVIATSKDEFGIVELIKTTGHRPRYTIRGTPLSTPP
jgi:hypothetical protein